MAAATGAGPAIHASRGARKKKKGTPKKETDTGKAAVPKQKGEQVEKRAKLETEIDHTNKEYLRDEPFQDITHLAGKLEKLKRVFLKYDRCSDGELDYMAVDSMARDLGIIRPMADLKKRVREITGNTRDAVSYKDCAMAILGRRSTMCQRIRRFSGREGDFEKSPCWLDRVYLSYVSHLEFTLSPNLLSPITLLPPPPPPSPADFGVMDNAETYPAA